MMTPEQMERLQAIRERIADARKRAMASGMSTGFDQASQSAAALVQIADAFSELLDILAASGAPETGPTR